MADKMQCLGCEAYLSSILRAYREGKPCPECGLPDHVMFYLEQLKSQGVDAKLLWRIADAETRAMQAEREAEWRLGQLNRIQSILHEDMPVGFDGF